MIVWTQVENVHPGKIKRSAVYLCLKHNQVCCLGWQNTSHCMPGDTVSLGVSVSIYMPTLHLIRFSCSIHMADHRACASLSLQDSQTNKDNFCKPSFCSVMKNVNMACTPNFCSEPSPGRVSRYKKEEVFSCYHPLFYVFLNPPFCRLYVDCNHENPTFPGMEKGTCFPNFQRLYKPCRNIHDYKTATETVNTVMWVEYVKLCCTAMTDM